MSFEYKNYDVGCTLVITYVRPPPPPPGSDSVKGVVFGLNCSVHLKCVLLLEQKSDKVGKTMA